MNIKDLNRDEFNALVDEFLNTQDNSGKEEWYCTDRGAAEHVLQNLYQFLFGTELAKDQRRKAYLLLKAEFEGDKP